jgi:hypothetical protein
MDRKAKGICEIIKDVYEKYTYPQIRYNLFSDFILLYRYLYRILKIQSQVVCLWVHKLIELKKFILLYFIWISYGDGCEGHYLLDYKAIRYSKLRVRRIGITYPSSRLKNKASREVSHLLALAFLLAYFWPWGWRRYVLPIRPAVSELHSYTTKKDSSLSWYDIILVRIISKESSEFYLHVL